MNDDANKAQARPPMLSVREALDFLLGAARPVTESEASQPRPLTTVGRARARARSHACRRRAMAGCVGCSARRVWRQTGA